MRRIKLYLMALATVTLWGASFPLTKAALAWMGPTALAFLRWAISAAVLVIWLARARQMEAAQRLLGRDFGSIAWIALAGVTLFYFLENLALRYTTAINAGVLSNLTSVFMVLIGTLWLRERLSALEWQAMAIAFLGAILVSQGAGHLTLSGTGLRGDGLMILATVFAALYSVGGKRLVATYPPAVVTACMAVLGALFLLPLALWEGLSLTLPPQAWLAVLLLGVGSGAIANLWWLNLLAHTTASRASMTLFLIPVISTALAVIALGEPLTVAGLVGACLVLLGVAIVQPTDGLRLTQRLRRPDVKP